MALFAPTSTGVVWETPAGPISLDERQCEALLDLLEPADDYAGHCAFNALYDAHCHCGGIERVTSRRAA